MSGEVTSAVAAIMGAFVGGLASLMSTWVGERSRHRRDMVQHEIAKRETAYADFIDKASKVFVASATHSFNDDEAELVGTVSLYAVASRIRLFASDPVMKEAEQVLDLIFTQYGGGESFCRATSEDCNGKERSFESLQRHLSARAERRPEKDAIR